MRFIPYLAALVLSVVLLVLGLTISMHWMWPLVVVGPLALLGTWDVLQTRHSILRGYPMQAHLRYLAETIRPEMMQYFVETDTEGRPFNRNTRSVVYQRSKNVEDTKSFGTDLDVYSQEYEWMAHSIAPHPEAEEPFRTTIGGPECTKPYDASVLNISAMSFGALSANAIRALNRGAKLGNFAHDTGEGGLSKYHRENGGDLIWEIGSGYFGCRNDDGSFNADLFAEQATIDQVKMVEIKVSQGAKAGHGGVLPSEKISPEIAETRKIPMGKDCISPAYHTAFSTPIGLLEFVKELRELSGGKPAGFKLCIGQPEQFLGICKAMVETGIMPDFIVVDGGEGGTGAGPIEFLDHMGTPLIEGLVFVHNALVGTGVRQHVRLGCSGKITTGFGMASKMALGADWCNVARGFMFSLGCIQAQRCNTNKCPVGIATQSQSRQRALVVGDKSERVRSFHANTLQSLAQVVAAAGLDHPSDLSPYHVVRRVSPTIVQRYSEIYDTLEDGELLRGTSAEIYRKSWDRASAERF